MIVRPSTESDRLPAAQLYADVAAERLWIGGEPPVDVDARSKSWDLEGDFVAEADGEIIGSIHVHTSGHGFGEIGMMVAKDWRGRGVGTALMDAAIAWSREQGLHKLILSVFAHNEAAIGLYRKLGFVEEGRRPRQYRRRNGELWDSVEMGLFI